MKSETFLRVLRGVHSLAWDALKKVIEGVLGGKRVQQVEIEERVNDMLYYFEKIDASMTLKLHFLHNHLDVLLKQLPEESDEQGERFHQITMPMEKRFKGKRLDALLAEVCWWTHKMHQFQNEDPHDTEYEGNTEQDMPLNPHTTCSDDEDPGDPDDNAQKPANRVIVQPPGFGPPKRRKKLTDPGPSTRMDIDD